MGSSPIFRAARTFNRRRFTLGVAAAGLGTLWESPVQAKRASPISIGYATLTWGDENARRAIADIAQVGYRGVQLRLASLAQFASPAVLAAELARARLIFSCLSGGSVTPDSTTRAAQIDKFLVGTRFAKAAGALAIQVTGPKRASAAGGRAELKAFAETLTELGKRTSAIGLPLGFHPQADQFGRTADEVNAILEASDPRHVKLLLDTGHHAAAGGDPATTIKDHAGRLLMLHLKDVKDQPIAGDDYEFVELGRGRVDFRAVIAALKATRYRGWAVVEMRPYSVREGHSAKDGAIANRAFLEKTLGLSV